MEDGNLVDQNLVIEKMPRKSKGLYLTLDRERLDDCDDVKYTMAFDVILKAWDWLTPVDVFNGVSRC